MSSKIATLAAAAAIAVGLFAGSAMAGSGYPPSLTGTWSAQDNQTPLTIIISQAGLPTGAVCASLSGTMATTDDLEGFYCPTTGRFNFIRIRSGQTIQEYSGNASTAASPEYISGIFGAVIQPAGGTLGEYSFFAHR